MKFFSALRIGFFFLWFFSFLIITPPAKSEPSHTVKPGETLWSIARKYHISVDQLWEANELSHDRIHPGVKLIIPQHQSRDALMPPAGKGGAGKSGESEARVEEMPDVYIVKKGDTLTKIAQRFQLRVVDLQEANQLPGPSLKVGQVLLLIRLDDEGEESETGREQPGGKKMKPPDEKAQKFFPGESFLVNERDRQLLVRVAQGFLGLKYSRGGTSIDGMDCSAFVQKVFRIFGVDLPRTAREQFQVGIEVAREALQIGDLVFFKRSKAPLPSHVGIYIGNKQFIHTSLRKRQVKIDRLDNRYFATRFIGAKRIEEAKKPHHPSPSGGGQG